MGNFKNEIQMLLKNAGETMDSAASKIGVSRRTLYNYLENESIPEHIASRIKTNIGIDISHIPLKNLQLTKTAIGENLESFLSDSNFWGSETCYSFLKAVGEYGLLHLEIARLKRDEKNLLDGGLKTTVQTKLTDFQKQLKLIGIEVEEIISRLDSDEKIAANNLVKKLKLQYESYFQSVGFYKIVKPTYDKNIAGSFKSTIQSEEFEKIDDLLFMVPERYEITQSAIIDRLYKLLDGTKSKVLFFNIPARLKSKSFSQYDILIGEGIEMSELKPDPLIIYTITYEVGPVPGRIVEDQSDKIIFTLLGQVTPVILFKHKIKELSIVRRIVKWSFGLPNAENSTDLTELSTGYPILEAIKQ